MVLEQQDLLLNQQEGSYSSLRKKLARPQMMEATRRRCDVPLGMVAASVMQVKVKTATGFVSLPLLESEKSVMCFLVGWEEKLSLIG